MSRARNVNKDLPERMHRRVRHGSKGQVWTSYFHCCNDITGKRVETPLGNDLAEAKLKWARVEKANAKQVLLMKHAFDRYIAEAMPQKSPRTQKDILLMLKPLRAGFDAAPISAVTPHIVAKYRDARSQEAPVRANREMSLLSTVWNHAREWGYTEKENPCRGVRKNKEKPRDFYADDQVWKAVYKQGCPELKNAMDIAYLTGQRPADVLKMKFSHINNNALEVSQNKTTKKLRILLTIEDKPTELLTVINRIKSAGGEALSDYMVCNARGDALTTQTLRLRFNKAKGLAKAIADDELAGKIELFQFRDTRSKAASELPLEHASRLLGHSKKEITQKVYRRIGDSVTPAR